MSKRGKSIGLALAVATVASFGVAALGGALESKAAPEVTIVLEAQSKMVRILGVPFEAWTFNQTVPGPIIRVTQGTWVNIELRNLHSEPHSVHTHFQHYPLANDGTSHTLPIAPALHQADDPFGALGITNAIQLGGGLGINPTGAAPDIRYDHDVARPGMTYTYRLFAGEVGTFVYHCHVFPVAEHIGRGLMGLIVVYPPGWTWETAVHGQMLSNGNTDAWVTDPQGQRYYEDVVILSELDLSSVTDKVPATTTGKVGKVNMVNFRTWNDPYYLGPVHDGTWMRVIVANLGEEVHSWHVHAHNFDVLDKFDPDKRVVRRADTLLVEPGGSYETVLQARHPGFWFVHDHSITASYQGMIAWLHVLNN